MTTPSARQVRLGELLVQRRSELAHQYIERRAFAEATGPGRGPGWERLLLDVENARQPGRRLRPKTVADLEIAYQLRRGAINAFLNGDTGSLAPAAPPPAPETAGLDAELLAALSRLPDGEREEITRLAVAFIETVSHPRAGRQAAG